MSFPLRSVWSELLPLPELASARVLALLRERRLGLRAAVLPGSVEHAGALVRACRAAGVPIGLWPMIDDARGRWPSAHNFGVFRAYLDELLARLTREAALPDEIVLDLEPPLSIVRAWLEGHGARLGRAPDATEQFRALVAELGARDLRTCAALVPLVLADRPHRAALQRALGTPADALPADELNVMLYSSMFQGYSRGLLGRRASLALLGRLARAARRRWGARAAVSLGAIGPGALGSEPTYPSPRQLREDVAAVRAAGVERMTLFDLAGALGRPPAETWLDAFIAAELP